MAGKLGAVAVLLCLAATGSADTVFHAEIQNITFDAAYDQMSETWTYDEDLNWVTQPTVSIMFFDVVITGIVTDGVSVASSQAAAYDLALSISGAGGEHLVANPSYNRYARRTTTPANAGMGTDVVIIPGSTWRWAGEETMSWIDPTDVNATGPASSWMAYIVARGTGTNTTIYVGSLIARIFYLWDGTQIDVDALSIATTSGSGMMASSFLRSSDGVNHAVIIPEPATTSLLAVGLIGLVVRRRGRK